MLTIIFALDVATITKHTIPSRPWNVSKQKYDATFSFVSYGTDDIIKELSPVSEWLLFSTISWREQVAFQSRQWDDDVHFVLEQHT